MIQGLVDQQIKPDGVQPGLGSFWFLIILVGATDTDFGDFGAGLQGRGNWSRTGDSSRDIGHDESATGDEVLL